MNKIIAKNIRTIREMKNLTRDFVAGEMEMSTSGYGKIERGEIDLTISKIVRIAKIFDITLSDLLFFDVSLFFTKEKNKTLYSDNFINKEVRVMKLNNDGFKENLNFDDSGYKFNSF
ncbi:helix-turn-helix domain-containing protein [Flavobacterium sp. DSR3-2]|uniref:helix-turn-helix domain-containing protein n=1 Tax=Flavobacterium sp. DSR3-2 TaxID=2804634 RepID=UPI003CF27494